MTAVRQPIREMAQVALDLLIRRLSLGADAEPRHDVVEPTLIVRDSCAPYSAEARARRRGPALAGGAGIVTVWAAGTDVCASSVAGQRESPSARLTALRSAD